MHLRFWRRQEGGEKGRSTRKRSDGYPRVIGDASHWGIAAALLIKVRLNLLPQTFETLPPLSMATLVQTTSTLPAQQEHKKFDSRCTKLSVELALSQIQT